MCRDAINRVSTGKPENGETGKPGNRKNGYAYKNGYDNENENWETEYEYGNGDNPTTTTVPGEQNRTERPNK